MSSSPNPSHTYRFLAYLHANTYKSSLQIRNEDADLFVKALTEGGSLSSYMLDALNKFFDNEGEDFCLFASEKYGDMYDVGSAHSVPKITNMKTWIQEALLWFKRNLDPSLETKYSLISIYSTDDYGGHWEMSVGCGLYDKDGKRVDSKSAWFSIGSDVEVFIKGPEELSAIWKDIEEYNHKDA